MDGISSFLHLLQKLKTNKRNGWLHKGISHDNTESIADHMYRMAIMALLVKDPHLDINKCIRMALVHDMAEAITGDITPDDGISAEEKRNLETKAMESIKTVLGEDHSFGHDAMQLWQEYSNDSTMEANFVKDLDKLELIFQAIEYEKSEGINFSDWIDACKGKIRHAELKEILATVLKERNQ